VRSWNRQRSRDLGGGFKMKYVEARELIPDQYNYNTWYPAEYNGQQFEIAVRKGYYLWVRYKSTCTVKSFDGTTRKEPCWEYYRTNKNRQWVYVDFEIIYEEVATC
jgi:hypothetical protein